MTDRSRRPTLFRSSTAVRSAVLMLSLLIAPRASIAQLADSVRIAAGTRVLVRMRDGTQGEWRLERASPDSLTLRRRVRGGDLMRTVPWSDMERVDTVVVAAPSARRMLAGGVAGGVFAVLAGIFTSGAAGPCHWDSGSCPGFAVAVYGPELIGAGVMTGAYLGLHRRPWHWSTAWRAPAMPAPRDH